jgi:ribosomal protein L20A (L18A)
MDFIIKGKLKKGDKFVKFSKTVSAETKNFALNKLKSKFGSIYSCKRNRIKISSVEEVK